MEMSHTYVTVQWNHKKNIYDRFLWTGIFSYLALFVLLSFALYSDEKALSPMIVLIRAFSSCAFLMLTIILSIGPLARLDRRFLPLLYNRRHFGVSMFLIALIHAVLAIFWYHGFGVANPILSVFTTNGSFTLSPAMNIFWISTIPFQPLGAIALVCLFLMAATSHDFWNTNLGAPVWKAIHMSVYLAYALIIVHVALGALQADNTGLLPLMSFASVVIVGGLHVTAAAKSAAIDKGLPSQEWVDIGPWRDIPNNRAIIVTIGSRERVAVFRYEENKLAAVSNACQHQNGPLGEGQIIDGCITCPWHGYQYRPEDGRSPAPFTEKIETYQLRIDEDQVLLNPTPLPRGTARPVIEISIPQNDRRGEEC
jgi:nitrite reductase/ring-hydroxylating ferredoxin subunit/DMSO/TMAO reductase YedYZ heme-binding membrane subunit